MKPHHLNRRMLLLGGIALAGLAACSGETAKPVADADPTLASTTLGKLRGVKTDDGVIEFLGVRYAQPPVGPLRFQAPKKLEPWQGEVAATEYGQPAVQMRTPGSAGAATYPPVVQAARAEAFASPENSKPTGDEDCLVLNVYTQKTGSEAGATRPVMVWIHGGGFAYGQAGTKIYRGHNLAKNHDVVFVGMVGKLTKLASGVLMTHYTRSKVDTGLLGRVTRAAGGSAELVERVDGANTARHAYELWESAGLLRAAGDVLCARVRDVLEAFSAEAGRRLPARIALVDFTGLTVVGSTEPHWVTS